MDKKVEQKKVQNIREMISMRFRLTHEKALQLRKGKNSFFSSIFDRIRGKLASSELEASESLFSLKYVEKLNQQCLLVGNQYQLSAIGISCLQDFVEASSEWSIAEDHPISNVFVSPKVRSLFVICQKKMHLYCYSLESYQQPPVKEQTITFSEPIYAVYVVKRAIVLVLMQTCFEVLQLTMAFGRTKLIKHKQYGYFSEKKEGLQVVSIPEDQGNLLQVFFKDTKATTIFTIYTLKIECLSCEQVTVGQLNKFCQVPQRYISTLQISHYRSDIYLVYVGLELYAVRNNYFLDSIITNTSKLRSFLKQFSSNFFFLYHKDRFELYRYQLNEKLAPQRFQVDCLDTIPITKPQGSFFLEIKQLGDHLVFIFQQPRSAESSELNFWLAIGDQVEVMTKIDKLYPSSAAQVEGADRGTIEDHIEMALQMGLSLDLAYLELWERSGKTSQRDYDLLIATQNYEMIAGELQKKLKKSSLKFLQLIGVMKRSLAMLEERVRQPQPSLEHIRQLASCHFLLCKYRMLQRVRKATGTNVKDLAINIQDYYHLTRIQLFKYLFELLNAYLSQRNKTLILLQIKALITQFSLIFRLKYHEILPLIIKTFKKDLIKFLKELPELLPQEGLTESVWTEINLRQTEDYLIIQNYANFQNKRNLEEFMQSKYFKVYLWHSHGALADSKSAIAQQLAKHTPESIFIQFYEQLLTLQFKPDELDQLVSFVQATYSLLPNHLRGRFRFYEALYLSFRSYHSAQRRQFMGTREFLKLKEDELFEIYFQEERAKKGIFLLKEVEPIYARTVEGGNQLFLASMFRFFQGNRSSWSDLKIVLNKFNNQKQDFHKYNFQVFEIMVRAIMEKVRIGNNTEEAGLSEVVSYLENIPFPLEHASLLQSLISIQDIRGQEETLRIIGINMTLREILQNGQEVIFRMVESEINKYRVRDIIDPHQLKLFAYKILTEVNYRKSNLYVQKHHNFPLKCFLILLMQDERHISGCRQLLADQFLKRTFSVDEKLIENIVIYLYRKRLSLNPVYEENKGYIDAIVNILDEDSVKRRFLQLSENYAGMFSSLRYKMKYPFFKTYYPTVDEVAAVVVELDHEELKLIKYADVFDLIIEFKALGQEIENIVETKRNRFANHTGEEKLQIMKHELYTVFFMNFMKHGLIKDFALPIAKEIMGMDTRYKIYNIIVPVFLIQFASRELIAQLVYPLGRLVSYYFNFQHELLDYVSSLFTKTQINAYTNQQLLYEFTAKFQQKKHQPIFNPSNHLFSAPLQRALSGLSRKEQADQFNLIFEQLWERISHCREEFVKVPTYLMLYRLLLHNPYVLAQYLNRRREGVNVCSLRALLTLLAAESLFDFQKMLELGEGIFSILMLELKSKILLQDILQMFLSGERYTEELKYTDKYCTELIKRQAEDLIGNSIISFRNKLAFFAALDISKIEADKEKNFQILMNDRKQYLSVPLIYPFEDRDKEYALPEEDLIIPDKHRKDKKLEFQEAKERSELCDHLNYFVQPSFKENDEKLKQTLAEFYLKMNKKLSKKHPIKMKSLRDEIPAFHSITGFEMIAPTYKPQQIIENQIFDQLKIQQEQDVMKKSQSLKIVVDYEQDDDFNPGKMFIDFLPGFQDPEQNKKFKSNLPSAIQSEIQLCLQGKQFFNPRVFSLVYNKQELFEKIVEQVYCTAYYSLLRRIEVIWNIKRCLWGNQSVEANAEAMTLRLGKCELVHSLLAKIQDIFTTVIFIQQFSNQALLQLVRQNASEAITHQEDILKIAEIVGVVFASIDAKQSILMMFLIRLCRIYSLTQDDRQQNHLKDQIIFIQQNIDPRVIAQAAETYVHARNEDLRSTGHVLQYFRSYKHHLSNTHIRIIPRSEI